MFDAASIRMGAQSASPAVPPRLKAFIEEILSSINTHAHVDCWGRDVLMPLNKGSQAPALVISIKHPGVFRRFLERRSIIVLLQAYMDAKLDFSGGIEDLIKFGHELSRVPINMSNALFAGYQAMALPTIEFTPHKQEWKKLKFGSRARDKESVRYHYDVGNDFYQLWLDKNMVYSCAHYDSSATTLDEAQEAKLDIICRKLQLRPGERLLDIGCGWSGLIRHAAKNYGATTHGITLSEAQLEYCRAKIREERLEDRVTVELRHYKDLQPEAQYDKISSIEMIEQVGYKNYPTYFGNIRQSLKTGGLFLCQAITSVKNRPHKDLAERFIADYIFPDGELANLPKTLAQAKDAGWETVDIESWRPHYARTLRDWAQRLDQTSTEAELLVGKQRVRLWHLYLMGCALSYESNRLGLYQLLFRKSDDAHWNLPLSRSGWLA